MSVEVLFWASCGALVYTLVGYPALIAVLARLRPRRASSVSTTPVTPTTPSVTIVVVARNEAKRIVRRIENLSALDYPAEQLNVIVGSDGSTDATVPLARGTGDSRLTVLEFDSWRGKPAVLNDAVARATGEIVVFADARQNFEHGALRALVAPFADPEVGAVSGELCLLTDPSATAVGAGVGFYWRYEKFMRRAESAFDSSVGATGAIYAIRRALFTPLPETTLLDDVLTPMRIVRAGYRTLFEPGALAYDYAADAAADEFARKVRTIAGTFQLFATNRWLFDPRANRLWFQTLSHKGLRLLGPLFLVVAFVANLALAGSSFYAALVAAQLALYASALFEHLRSGRPLHNRFAKRVLGIAYAFCLLQAATVVGFLRFATGRQRVTWRHAPADTGANFARAGKGP